MTDKKIWTIRLLPDGFYISDQFHPLAPGADFEERLEETFLNTDFVSQIEEQDEVECIVETSRFCLSPMHVSEEEATEMFSLSVATAKREETLLHETDETQAIRFTYALSARTHHFLQRTLPGVEFHLDAHLMCLQHTLTHGMMVKADASVITLIAYRNGALQLCNRIETRGNNNQSYFILSAWAQLGFDPIDDTLLLESNNQLLRQTLNTYIKCVS